MRVNVARVWEDSDYTKVRSLCESEEGWTEVYNKKGIEVYTQTMPDSHIQMIKAHTKLDDVSSSLAYDVLHDDAYRSKWDKYMTSQSSIGLLNPNNEIGYYALSSIPPIRARDFLMQKSWLDVGDVKMICSHSVCHEDHPPAKGYIRATVFLSGYIIKTNGDGCDITYVSHSDPRGKLPTWLVNRLTKVVAPKVIKKLHKACLGYADWKKTHHPTWKPWLYPDQQMDMPRVSLDKCQPREYEQEVVDESNISVISVPSTRDDDED